MFMFYLFTSLLVYFACVYVFFSNRKLLLLVMLSLVFIVFSLFMLIVIFLIEFDYDCFFLLFFWFFSDCEVALGLSILVTMIRCHGKEFLNSFSSSLC
uniref:NADH-ubiquinone oxidoreductase chain 4L n=1 Tax=Rhinopodisma eminifrontus TaxID=2728163 RepID=A0A7L9QCR4_9ORTH|nr:NADH dehydrogenase subunit 4L [Rhinopodisma eminifrontus]